MSTIPTTTTNKPKRPYTRRAPNPKTDVRKITELLSGRKLKVTEAAKVLNCHPNSIYQAMHRKEINVQDYDLQSLKDAEVDELYIIAHEARQHLYKLLKGGKLRGIETTAILDRVFQQRRELQGKAHTAANIFTLIVQKADETILDAKCKEIIPGNVS